MDESPLLHPMSREMLTHRGILGALAGLVAGVPMGVLMHLGTDVVPWLGLFLGETSAVYGWVVHLFTSAVFGLLFAVFVSLRFFEELAASVTGSTILGVAHGMVLSFVTIGVALPIVTEVLVPREAAGGEVLAPRAAGFGASVVFGLAHLVYGVVLGVIYGYYHESLE